MSRGAGRTEVALFNRVKGWPARSSGLILMIVPDYVLADADVGLAVAVERDFELLGLWRYPEPQYADFKLAADSQMTFDKIISEHVQAGGTLISLQS